MKLLDFENLMHANHLASKGELGFGNIDGYPVFVKLKKSRSNTVEIHYTLEGVLWQDIREAIIQVTSDKKGKIIYENNQIKITMRLHRMTGEANFSELLHGITDVFKQLEIEPPKHCSICQKEGCDSFAIIGQGNKPVHRECLQEQMNHVRERMQSGNYLVGIIGALIGTLVGIIPSVFSLWMLGEAYSVFFLLIPLCIYYGYKLLHGKMDRFVLYVTILLSIVSVYLMQMIVQVLKILTREEMQITFKNFSQILVELLKVEDIWVTMTQASNLNFLFIIVGILITWEQISVTNKKLAKDIEEVVDTLTANPNDK